jgi:hypothetical protein
VKIARGFGNWEKCVQIMERYFVIGDLLSIAPIHALDVSEVGHQGMVYGLFWWQNLYGILQFIVGKIRTPRKWYV